VIVFCVLIVPSYALSLWLNTTGMNFIRKQYSDSIVSNAAFYAEQLNRQIAFIRNQQLQLLNDSDLQNLSFLAGTLNKYELLQYVKKITERLVAIQSSDDFVVNAGVYIQSLGRVISAKGGMTDPSNSEWKTVSDFSSSTVNTSMIDVQGRLFFVESSNNGSIVSYVELSSAKFSESLANLAKPGNGTGAVLSFDRETAGISPQVNIELFKDLFEPSDWEKTKRQPGVRSDVRTSGNKRYEVTSERISSVGWILFTYIDQNKATGPLGLFLKWLTALSIISIAVIFLFAFSIHAIIHRPLRKLIRSFESLKSDNRMFSDRSAKDNEFLYLFRSFDQMIDRLNDSIQQNYEQRLALRQSELKQLQSQINPHFLYNGFYNIYRLSKTGDLDSVSSLSQKLSSYYQFITRSGAAEVPLSAEYRHAMDYCDIQRIRFSNRIRIDAAVLPEASSSILVPRLIIQPVIENAFEHSFESEPGGGYIRILVSYEEDRLIISVEDDGRTLTDESLDNLRTRLADVRNVSETTGLVNVARRIVLKYGDSSGLYVSRSELSGLKAEIVIIPNDARGTSDV
jgi:two-component system sensor histidine kinase YesM